MPMLDIRRDGTLVFQEMRIDLIRGHIIRFIKRNDLVNDTAHPSRGFIQERVPQYWKEAQVLSKHGLL